jgi:CRISPR/Cas system-associated exonuclease Cas4 (RecB family)
MKPTEISIRASSLGRIESCPLSYWLSQGAPEQAPSPEADSGTRIHAVLAGEPPAIPLTAGEQDCVDLCREIHAGLVESLPTLDETLTEQELSIVIKDGWIQDGWILTGHCDLVEIRGTHMVVVDWKTGRGEVPHAALNLQLKAYAIMLLKDRPSIRTVTLAIIQPFGKNQGSQITLERGDFVAAWKKLVSVFQAVAKAADSLPAPSESACKYCPALAICPAHRASIAQASTLTTRPAHWETATVEDKLTLWRQIKLAKKAIAEIEGLFRRDLESNADAFGGQVYIGRGRTTREVTDTAGLYAHLKTHLGLSPEEFAGAVKVKLTELEGIAKKRSTLKGKAWSVFFDEAISAYGESTTTRGSLESML